VPKYAESSKDLNEYCNPSTCLYHRNFSQALMNFSRFYELVDKVEPRYKSKAGFFVYEKMKGVPNGDEQK